MSQDIAVAIAFFQRKAGVRKRTLRSVATQQGVDFARVRAVVVDDGSPVAARLVAHCAEAAGDAAGRLGRRKIMETR